MTDIVKELMKISKELRKNPDLNIVHDLMLSEHPETIIIDEKLYEYITHNALELSKLFANYASNLMDLYVQKNMEKPPKPKPEEKVYVT